MAGKACFITGTDTGVGKTSICLALIENLKKHGCRTGAVKPVASGSEDDGEGPRNRDALLLREHTGMRHEYRIVNPYALTIPSAPVIAARHDGLEIEPGPILESFQTVSVDTDVVLMEGVGGWHIQLNDDLWMSDLVKSLNLPVIMVVGMRLGCINHALLTYEAILGNDCWLLGWIGNQIDQGYQDYEDSLAILSRTLAAPMIGSVPFIPGGDIEKMAGFLKNICLPEFGLIDNF